MKDIITPVGPALLPMPWHEDAELILKDDANRLVCIVGEPGCGKSTWAKEKAAQMTGQHPEVIDGSPGIEERHIFGKTELVGTSSGATQTVDSDGPLPRALKQGKWLIAEEFSLIPHEVRSYFLPLRGQKHLTNPLTGEVIPIPNGFRLVATSNFENMACRRNSGTTRALLDDFLILEVPEPTEKEIRAWLKFHHPRAAPAKLDWVIEKWLEYRNLSASNDRDKTQYLSYRAAAHLLRLSEAGMRPEKAVLIALVNKYISDADLFTTAKIRSNIG